MKACECQHCMQAARGPSGASQAQPIEVMYSNFVKLANDGAVRTAFVDEGGSMVHFSADPNKMQSRHPTPARKWYHIRKQPAVEPSKDGKLVQLATRTVDKDTSYVKVCNMAAFCFLLSGCCRYAASSRAVCQNGCTQSRCTMASRCGYALVCNPC